VPLLTCSEPAKDSRTSYLAGIEPSPPLNRALALLTLLACSSSFLSSLFCFSTTVAMASTSVARLVAYRRPTPYLWASSLRLSPLGSIANFSSSVSRAATPAGPPQPGFRLPAPRKWDQDPESSLDKASKYFLMAELFRGMYVVLEQFFRPP
jgi:hypothetical protein